MKKNKTVVLPLIPLGIFTIPFIIFVLKFYHHPFNPSDRGTFGNYNEGLIGAMIAFAGIIITYEFNYPTLKETRKLIYAT